MLYIFDKDGTLVDGVGNRPANSPSEQKPLPGVVEKLAELRNAGHTLAIATNQGGVAWGFISLSQAYRLAHDAAEKVGGMDAISVCPYDERATGPRARTRYARPSRRRKPEPGMIEDLARRLGYDLSEVAFVGDRASDRQAAEAAGVTFLWAADFFLPEWLQGKYWTEGLSLQEIGDLAGVSGPGVLKWMRKYGIPRRDPGVAPVFPKKQLAIDVSKRTSDQLERLWKSGEYESLTEIVAVAIDLLEER